MLSTVTKEQIVKQEIIELQGLEATLYQSHPGESMFAASNSPEQVLFLGHNLIKLRIVQKDLCDYLHISAGLSWQTLHLTFVSVAKFLDCTTEQQAMFKLICKRLVFLNEDGPKTQTTTLYIPRDEANDLMQQPNDGTYWYIPYSARQATRLYAETNELLYLLKVPGIPPSIEEMTLARKKSIFIELFSSPSAVKYLISKMQ